MVDSYKIVIFSFYFLSLVLPITCVKYEQVCIIDYNNSYEFLVSKCIE